MNFGSTRAVIVTNLRCNQACRHCNGRAPSDDLRFISPEAVRRRIAAAIASGATEILFTGGEPTMRSDLEALIADAIGAGATAVALETNGTLIDSARASRLRAAGLASARVNLARWGVELDEITRDPGGFKRTTAGIKALAAAGVTVDVVTSVVRSNAAALPDLPARIVESLGGAVRSMEISVPVEAPDPRELLRYEEALPAMEALATSCRKLALPASFHPIRYPPPCILTSRSLARLSSLYSLPRGTTRLPGHSPVEACSACVCADRCPGFADAYMARWGLPAIHPIGPEAARRFLSLSRAAYEQIERELATRSPCPDGKGGSVWECVIRVNFRCNQACAFCFVATQLPPARPEAIERAIAGAVRRSDKISLSGGEPTLDPRLPEYVRLAASGPHPVTLQTNAVRLADADVTKTLVDAGMGHAFVSLHGATQAVAEAVTGSPGTFARTLAGIDNLQRERVPITLNFVLCGPNAHELSQAVELAARRWPGATFNLSFVALSTELVPRDRRLIESVISMLP
jgi:MoaA/NifB/PqqE/SkfB family radical SAM enzyme